jgi:hypothetical protein
MNKRHPIAGFRKLAESRAPQGGLCLSGIGVMGVPFAEYLGAETTWKVTHGTPVSPGGRGRDAPTRNGAALVDDHHGLVTGVKYEN